MVGGDLIYNWKGKLFVEGTEIDAELNFIEPSPKMRKIGYWQGFGYCGKPIKPGIYNTNIGKVSVVAISFNSNRDEDRYYVALAMDKPPKGVRYNEYMFVRNLQYQKKEKRIERGNKVGRQQKRHRKSRTSPNYMEYS